VKQTQFGPYQFRGSLSSKPIYQFKKSGLLHTTLDVANGAAHDKMEKITLSTSHKSTSTKKGSLLKNTTLGLKLP